MAAPRVHPTLLILPTLGAAAYFFAQGTNALLGAHWLTPSDLPIARAPVLMPPADGDRASPAVAALFEPRATGPEDPPPTPSLQPCDASLRLVGTVVDGRAGESAAALLVGAGTHVTVRVGDALAEWTVAAIGAEHLELEAEGRPACRLALFGARAPDPDASATARAPDPAPGPRSDHIERERLQAVLRNPGVLGSVRVVPVAGQPTLFGIRSGSPLAELGLRNGDRIVSVEGMEVTTLDDALTAYARLQNAESITLRLLRRGQERTFSYRIE